MKKQSGFTLLELMVTITIAAVLVTVGVPGFQQMVQTNQRAAASNEMISVLNRARSEAVKLNMRVTLCPSTDGASCTGGTNWHEGWIAFEDEDGDVTVDAGDGEEIISATDPLEGTTVRSTFTSLTYRPNGRMRTSASADEGEFILCDARGADKASVVLIWNSGRPQASETDLANNAPTTCTPS